MRDLTRLIIAALFVLLVSGPNPALGASESYISGGLLSKLCKTSPNAALGYVLGVIDVLRGVYGSTPEFCIPKKVETGQLEIIACKYFRDHPEEEHLTGWSLTSKALSEAFPCKK